MRIPILLARQTVLKSSRGPWLGDMLRAYARLAAVGRFRQYGVVAAMTSACFMVFMAGAPWRWRVVTWVFPRHRGPNRNWIESKRPFGLDHESFSTAAADLGPAVITVQVYGSAPRPDLDTLATKISHALSG